MNQSRTDHEINKPTCRRGRPKTNILSREDQLKLNSRKYREKKRLEELALQSQAQENLLPAIQFAIKALSDTTLSDEAARHEALSILRYYIERGQ